MKDERIVEHSLYQVSIFKLNLTEKRQRNMSRMKQKYSMTVNITEPKLCHRKQ